MEFKKTKLESLGRVLRVYIHMRGRFEAPLERKVTNRVSSSNPTIAVLGMSHVSYNYHVISPLTDAECP